MEATNEFSGGINSDASQLVNKKSTYQDALNVDIILDEINGSIALTNSKGNKLQATIPETHYILYWETKPYDVILGDTSKVVRIGATYGIYTSTVNSTNFSLYSFFKTTFAAEFATGKLKLSYSDSKVTIVDVTGDLSYYDFQPFNDNGFIPKGDSVIPVAAHYPIGYTVIKDDIYIIKQQTATY